MDIYKKVRTSEPLNIYEVVARSLKTSYWWANACCSSLNLKSSVWDQDCKHWSSAVQQNSLSHDKLTQL